jgi:hypothetical protein
MESSPRGLEPATGGQGGRGVGKRGGQPQGEFLELTLGHVRGTFGQEEVMKIRVTRERQEQTSWDVWAEAELRVLANHDDLEEAELLALERLEHELQEALRRVRWDQRRLASMRPEVSSELRAEGERVRAELAEWARERRPRAGTEEAEEAEEAEQPPQE